MATWEVGKWQRVKVIKIAIGIDGRTYVTIEHKDADNYPVLRLKEK